MQTKRGDVLCALFMAVVVGHLALSNCGLPRWWSLGIEDCATNIINCESCDNTTLLNPQQKCLCTEYGDKALVRAISKGIFEAIGACQREFARTQWNCTTFGGDYLFGKYIENGTREMAILNAFLTAGAAHGIAEACHENVIYGCPCDPAPSQRIDNVTYLQDCGDNVDFAIEFLKIFYGLGNSSELRALVDKWNNELGYEAINNLTTYCRCTGLTASCTIQTCYDKAPSMHEIGSRLRLLYEGSQKVIAVDGELVTSNGRPPIKGLPCYTHDTPDLCATSREMGILGTSGCKCNPFGSGSDSCNNLCCSGFHEVRYNITKEKCRFVWCCYINCVTIDIVEVTDYLCN